MGFTNYPNGLTSFGIPLFGGGTIPTSPGTVYFVNYGTGSDANRGTDIAKPLKTVEYAYSLVRDGYDDIIALTGSSTHVLSAMLTVSKSRVHFIGIDGTNGRFYGQNAKVSLTATTGATNVFTMKNTGVRNSFTNIKFINASTVTEGIYCVGEGGEYAVYTNCEIYKSTDLDVTGSAELVLNGDSAQFIGCTIGSLADARVGAIIRAAVLLTAGLVDTGKVTRDCVFEDCLFWIQAANAANRFVYGANATDVERMLLFKRCGFINNLAGAGTPAQAIAMGASLTTGNIVLDPACYATKVTKLSTTTGVLVTGAAPNSGQGIAVNAA
jgi:hypothetical protein